MNIKKTTTMDRKTELDARRFNLIRRITEIEDEELLESIEYFIAMKSEVNVNHVNYPYAPTRNELRSIIEEVLEQDRNGEFIDGEVFEREFALYMDQVDREMEARRL